MCLFKSKQDLKTTQNIFNKTQCVPTFFFFFFKGAMAMIQFKWGSWNWTERVLSLSGFVVATEQQQERWYYVRRKKESGGLLCGRSALVYSVQLNKLKCQGHNASGTLWIGEKTHCCLQRCWAAPLLMWLFQYMQKHRMETWETTLFEKGE